MKDLKPLVIRYVGERNHESKQGGLLQQDGEQIVFKIDDRTARTTYEVYFPQYWSELCHAMVMRASPRCHSLRVAIDMSLTAYQ
jgi:hypothetical protein